MVKNKIIRHNGPTIINNRGTNMNTQRLFRSRRNYMVAGVCGGLGEYFNIDPTIIRLAAVLSLLLAGSGLLVYLVAWIIIPAEPRF
jgi:phage shock protein C